MNRRNFVNDFGLTLSDSQINPSSSGTVTDVTYLGNTHIKTIENIININQDMNLVGNEGFTEVIHRKKRNTKRKRNFRENEIKDFGVKIVLAISLSC